MLRFYFNIHDGVEYFPDVYGDEFDSLEDARQHAQAILADWTREEIPVDENRSFMCEIRDEQHDVLYRCTLSMSGEHVRKLVQTNSSP